MYMYAYVYLYVFYVFQMAELCHPVNYQAIDHSGVCCTCKNQSDSVLAQMCFLLVFHTSVGCLCLTQSHMQTNIHNVRTSTREKIYQLRFFLTVSPFCFCTQKEGYCFNNQIYYVRTRFFCTLSNFFAK